MTPERRVRGVGQESEDGKKGILRFKATTQDGLEYRYDPEYCESVWKLLGDYIDEKDTHIEKGTADFSDYEGVEIPTIYDWLDEDMICGVTDWMEKGIEKHYRKGNASLGFRFYLFFLGTAMREGIKNALEHGNRENPKKKVLIKWKLKNSGINVSIIDEGTEIIDLTPKSHITGDFLDEVFSGGGNGVMIIKEYTEALGGTATWKPINNGRGQKIGTELKIEVPIIQPALK